MATNDYTVLDLFAGLGGFSSAFRDSDRWSVTTVEIAERFDPDIQADVFDLRPSDFATEFDVVLASPPCIVWTTIRCITTGGDESFVDGRPNTDEAKDALALVHHTEGLIRGLSPDYWFMENPRGRLRTFFRPPQGTVWYCQYGHESAKPTDLWGDHPAGFRYRKCSRGNDACGHTRTESYSEQDGGSSERQGLLKNDDSAERAKVPYELSAAIRAACERGLDGEGIEQSTLDAVAN